MKQERTRLAKGIIDEVERRGYQFEQATLDELAGIFNRIVL